MARTFSRRCITSFILADYRIYFGLLRPVLPSHVDGRASRATIRSNGKCDTGKGFLERPLHEFCHINNVDISGLRISHCVS